MTALEANAIVQEQLTSLDDTDAYASVWSEALSEATTTTTTGHVKWGGRGKGGRGLARQTFQPKDVVVENVSLQYLEGGKTNTKKGGGGIILENSRLKLLSGHVYALVGRNGCGKSTLLRRMHAHKIPGLSPHITTLYLPQHNDEEALQIASTQTSILDQCAIDVMMTYQETIFQSSENAIQLQITELEDRLESIQLSSGNSDDNDNDNDDDIDPEQLVEDICEQISNLEDRLEKSSKDVLRKQATEVLESWGIGDELQNIPYSQLTSGQRKKVLLAVAYICQTDVVLLDEPAQDLDIPGLIHLRRLIEMCREENRTVVLVSHDVDLVNDVATDIIYFSNRQLYYFPGNYDNFQILLEQHGLQALREQVALEKKREHMLQTLDNMKKQPPSKRDGGRRKAKQIEARKKKLERTGIQRDEKGHRWHMQKAGTGIQRGAINSLDASTRKGMSSAQLLKQAQQSVQQPPDKAVQFVFRDPPSVWGEALITAFDLGYKFQGEGSADTPEQQETKNDEAAPLGIIKKPGFMFDSVDLCVEEGSKVCILGSNGSGKSTLLRLLAKTEPPTEGTVHHASGLTIGFWDANMLKRLTQDHGPKTSLEYLQEKYSHKTEQDIRGELTSFGLGPSQISRPLHYLSGGEQTRLALVDLMLQDPPVLILDNPTCHLDVESVKAMTYGLQQWKGTVVMVSHDACFLRSLDVRCFVLMEEEGKLRWLDGGMDTYLKHFRQ
eukprot:CAMPEP_0119556620 /NCGR_PEP_ID=MMETSP1352-20130426/8499_1 /TAXON_ID=265584 /ORGANISM="Stauroneis constricta, Strain CCMP1120" /LENGTH=724 /DNA_ID=CAMNT_0007603597 /DNA_START=56 /DNA_END=2230 /DNA_ORIENTATION=-